MTTRVEKNQNKEQQQSDDNIPEDLWTSIADNLPSMLPEQHEIPSDLMPFDPTLDAEVDQKPIALFKIQKYLKEKELVRAIALLRASRDIWPDGDIFGAVGLPPEDEFLVLKEIFSADIPVPADILLPAVLSAMVSMLLEGPNVLKQTAHPYIGANSSRSTGTSWSS
ncbi:Protein timeless [Nymphon striatum]|nr:Protein timeless [Nymphon striatum]